MNAAFLIMTSAALAGADPAPPPPPPAAPIVVSGAGCNNCGAPATGCCPKPSLLDRIKGRLGSIGKKSHGCGCGPAPCAAPAPCAPAPVVVHAPRPAPCPTPCAAPAPCNTCNTCPKSIADRPNLLDKLKSRLGSKKGCGCAPACDPCGASHLITAPPTGGTTNPPKEMPKGDKPKGGNTSSIPQPLPGVPAGAIGSPY